METLTDNYDQMSEEEKAEQKSWLQKEIRGFKVGGLLYCLVTLGGFVSSVAIISSKITAMFDGIMLEIHNEHQRMDYTITDVSAIKVKIHEKESEDKDTKDKVTVLYANYLRNNDKN